MKILIMGLPGAGKTTLAKLLAPKMGAIHFNADIVRATMNKDLGFSAADRVEHARRMGCMCQYVKDSGHIAIADFVCPTPETRSAFNADLTVWVDTLKEGRFADTNKLFIPPDNADITIRDYNYEVEDLNTCLHLLYKML